MSEMERAIMAASRCRPGGFPLRMLTTGQILDQLVPMPPLAGRRSGPATRTGGGPLPPAAASRPRRRRPARAARASTV